MLCVGAGCGIGSFLSCVCGLVVRFPERFHPTYRSGRAFVSAQTGSARSAAEHVVKELISSLAYTEDPRRLFCAVGVFRFGAKAPHTRAWMTAPERGQKTRAVAIRTNRTINVVERSLAIGTATKLDRQCQASFGLVQSAA